MNELATKKKKRATPPILSRERFFGTYHVIRSRLQLVIFSHLLALRLLLQRQGFSNCFSRILRDLFRVTSWPCLIQGKWEILRAVLVCHGNPQYLERKLHAHVYVYQYAHIGRVHIDIHKRVYAPIHVVYV